ncbi:ureidoacrylate peracid hydrolase [Ancylobacter sp. 3268]|uniref:cysteine hydrolase family protein n=1 Tax=Ancylobacter sp. 3268 TaxID=2817752 RepID=UPI002864DFBC|nr:cysteine hydrolase [Ancylobacter sp. 3268]MDR6950695.1 ureidoacrylate peracid hydrolase [Ancylobacter sp. 3268]
MHKVKLEDDIVQIALQRRGRLRLFESIDPKRTAHLVIDMQVGFMTPGAPAEIAPAAAIIPNINRISAACRQASALNVFIQNSISEESKNSWSNWFDAFWTSSKREGMYSTFTVGQPGHALHPGIETEPGDMRINKFRFGAFVDGSSDLHEQLGARDINTVIITGCATNICCESTARDAMMLNYKVLFVSDGTATHTDFEHNTTLNNMMLTFADVVSTDDVTALLQA